MLAVPSVGRRRRAEIIESLKSLPVKVQSLPGVMDLAHGKVQVSDLHDLDIEDLLGRGAVKPDRALLEENILGKVVLITGAGGSIRSEEHTSELQSLMRISYAVFCLKKKKTTKHR